MLRDEFERRGLAPRLFRAWRNFGAVTSVTPSSVPRNQGWAWRRAMSEGHPSRSRAPRTLRGPRRDVLGIGSMIGAGVFALSARPARSAAPRSRSRGSPLVPWRASAAIAAIAGLSIVLDGRIVPEPACSDRGSGAGDSDARTTSGRMAEHFKPDVPSDPAVEFLLTFARVGHDAGYPTADLERRVSSLADAVGVEAAQVSATPTTVEISLGSPPRQRSYAIRARPPLVDLDAIARLDAVVRDVLDERLTAQAALEQVVDVTSRPLRRRWFVQIPAYALAGASATPACPRRRLARGARRGLGQSCRHLGHGHGALWARVGLRKRRVSPPASSTAAQASTQHLLARDGRRQYSDGDVRRSAQPDADRIRRCVPRVSRLRCSSFSASSHSGRARRGSASRRT
jgi:Putative threonine/serine exporter